MTHRVSVPLDVTMPHLCCACASPVELELVDARVSDDRRSLKLALPFCAPCRRRDRVQFWRGLVVFLAVGLGGTVSAALWFHYLGRPGDPAFGETVSAGALLTAILAVLIYPRIRRRPVMVVLLDRRHKRAVLKCTNERLAHALADQNPETGSGGIPPARVER